MSVTEDKIKELETRANKLKLERNKLEKEKAVLEHQYDQVADFLTKQGIPVENMSSSEIKSKRLELAAKLEEETRALEAEILKGESLLENFKASQG